MRSLFALFLVILGARTATAAITFREVPLPQPRDSNPFSIKGDDANDVVWFTDLTFRQVGYIRPDGSIVKFKLTDSVDPNNEMRPLSITAGPDGNAWFTGYITNSSGSPLDRSFAARVTLNGTITVFPLPTGNACRDFFGTPACDITAGDDGNLYFTETQVKKIGRITTAGQITEFPINGSFPLMITTGDDGNVWWTNRITPTIGRITPAGTVTEFPLPPAPTGKVNALLDITGDVEGDNTVTVAFTNSGTNQVGVVSANGTITQTDLPSGLTPGSIVSFGSTVVVTAGKSLVEFDPSDKSFVQHDVPAANGLPVELTTVDTAPKPELYMRSLDPATRDSRVFEVEGLESGDPTPDEVRISKRFPEGFVRVGDEVLAVIKVKNLGQARTRYRVDDILQECFEPIRRPGEYQVEGQKISATFDVDPGQEVEIGFALRVLGTCANKASVFLAGSNAPLASDDDFVNALSDRDEDAFAFAVGLLALIEGRSGGRP